MGVQKEAAHADGFTLIELLVVVLILGILAAIAMPTMLNQRVKAWEDAVVSDIRNAALVMEDVYSETVTYPATGPVPGFNSSGDVAITVAASTTVGYCLEASHPGVDRDLDGAADVWRFDTRILAASAGVERGSCPP